VALLFYRAAAGHEKAIVDVMTNKTDKGNRSQKLTQVVELLRFVLTLDDEEIIKSTIESVIELLEEENNK
jgi:hypothetical protein